MRIPPLAIAGAVIVVLAIILFGSWYQIDQGEEGVVLRNGAVTGTVGPGLHFKLPIVDDVKEISLQSHTKTFEAMESYSRDQQPAQIRLSVSYHVIPGSGAKVYAEYGGVDNMIARLVEPRVPALFKNVFGQYDALGVIQQRAKLNLDALSALQAGIGDPIIVESVQVEDIKFSAAYENSIEQKQLATVEVQKRQQELAQQEVQAKITRYPGPGGSGLGCGDCHRQCPGGAASRGGRGLLDRDQGPRRGNGDRSARASVEGQPGRRGARAGGEVGRRTAVRDAARRYGTLPQPLSHAHTVGAGRCSSVL